MEQARQNGYPLRDCKMGQFLNYLSFIVLMFAVVANLVVQPAPTIYTKWEPGFTHSLQHTHDMALPAWGPYSTKFNGISHVPRSEERRVGKEWNSHSSAKQSL